MYYFDSDTSIEFLRGKLPQTYQIMQSSSPRLFGIPAIVEAELRFGAANSNNPEENRLLVERFLSAFTIIPFDSIAAKTYAEIRLDLQKHGNIIGPNDLLIAATAKANNAVLISNNVRVFSRVKGLALESWAEIDHSEAYPTDRN